MLSVKDLSVAFRTRKGEVNAVRGVSFDVAQGETLGIVGESGSGKSVTSYAVLRILDEGGEIRTGEVSFNATDLRAARESAMRDIRGGQISMIFQNPRAALNPIRKVGHQIEDVLRRHGKATRSDAKAKAIEALEAVRIRDAAARYDAYPFELSGGMCQRVVIAIALACDPQLLIADEPTTGLDITTQKAVMDLVQDLIHERGMGSMVITHDLGLAAEYCDRIVVMKDGEIVEQGTPATLFSRPRHPYTHRLVEATPRIGGTIRGLLPAEARTPAPRHMVQDRPVLELIDVRKTFQSKSGPVEAVKGVSFTIKQGQSLGLVGESGSGKSTTSEMIVRLSDPTGGKILFEGQDISATPAVRFARHPLRRDIQMVFQDATDSLNPRDTAASAISEPLRRIDRMRGTKLSARVDELADMVGLPRNLLTRYPHQLSGGQKARVGIARAITLNPKLLILDEPTAALDVSIQALVLNLLVDLRAQLGMSYLFVSHDLNVVRLLCDQVLVMRGGEIIEQGPTAEVMTGPTHDYTRALLASAPQPPAQAVA
ncbi:MAG: ABC transporter ATP-binding protein [Pseudomonadota bacterium]